MGLIPLGGSLGFRKRRCGSVNSPSSLCTGLKTQKEQNGKCQSQAKRVTAQGLGTAPAKTGAVPGCWPRGLRGDRASFEEEEETYKGAEFITS